MQIFRKSVLKIQVLLKPDRNNGTLHENLCKLVIIFRSVLVTMRNVSYKVCIENRNTYSVLSNFFFFPKLCPLRDNVEKYGTAGQATDENIIRRMRFACWINKAADRHLEYIKPLIFYGNNCCTNAPQCHIINATLSFFSTRILSDIVNFWKTSSKLQLRVYRHCLKLHSSEFYYMTLRKARRKRWTKPRLLVPTSTCAAS